MLLVQIHLLHQRREELGFIVLLLVFPEELAPVHDLAVAQMKEIDSHERGLRMRGENIDVVALSSSHFLALVHLFDG